MIFPARLLLGSLLSLLLSACATDPVRAPPALVLPDAFRHADGWQRADAVSPVVDTRWWRAYRDPELATLLEDVARANASLAQADARRRQALARVASARASALPSMDGGVAVTRSGGTTPAARLYEARLEVGWLPDLWGRVALETDAARADADAAAATLAAARLALQLSAAQGYVRLRTLDLHQVLYERALAAAIRVLHLTHRQYEAGLVARADIIQAQTQVESLQLQQLSVARQRTQEEHALAVLAGRTPADWQLVADGRALPALPGMPAQVPAGLLLQRADLAAAERAMAAANARIGVARRAWLPTLSLGASGALRAGRFGDLLDAPVRVWSLGPALAASLFDGGARRADLERLAAAYDEQAAAWRGSVLDAIRETEDALAALRSLDEELRQHRTLVALAEDNERVATLRYEAGEVSFLEVATAQSQAIASRRAALDVEAARLLASMELIAALGGGWQPGQP